MKHSRPALRVALALAATAALSSGITAPGAGAAATGGCALVPAASCRNANLAGQDLSGRDLRRVDFTGASLRGTSLAGANLEGATLENADLRSATLRRAGLSRANVVNANLEGADVVGATAPQTNFRHANVRTADFRSTNLQGAQFGGADAGGASFEHAHLQDATFHAADLHNASFVHATFQHTNFDGSKVRGIHLFPSRVGDDAVARRGLFFYVYLHLDAYSDFGFCNNSHGGQATHTTEAIYCYATGQDATTIPALRGSKRRWGWSEHGSRAYVEGGGARLEGSFEARTFAAFHVKHATNLGLHHAYLPTGNGAKGHPGGPFDVQLTSRTYNPQGSFRYGYILRMSGYLQRGE